jgi:hypothetical protein
MTTLTPGDPDSRAVKIMMHSKRKAISKHWKPGFAQHLFYLFESEETVSMKIDVLFLGH